MSYKSSLVDTPAKGVPVIVPWFYEAIGYAASLLVAISVMMRSVLKLRIINLFGAACFTLYGVLIRSYPVAGMNAFIVVINLYYLTQLLRTRAAFSVVAMRPDEPYLHTFLAFYAQDVRRFFPRMPDPLPEQHQIYLIVRDAVPVGLVVGEMEQGQTLRIDVDYVIPGYRDLQPGRYFYMQYARHLRATGIRQLRAFATSRQYQIYLKRMGFTPDPHVPEQFRRILVIDGSGER